MMNFFEIVLAVVVGHMLYKDFGSIGSITVTFLLAMLYLFLMAAVSS